MSAESRSLVICADDYGLAPGVSDAILALLASGRLSATSCMSTCADWRRAAAPLRAVVAARPADVGLHLTLTEQAPLTACPGLAVGGLLPALPRVLALALSGRLPRAVLRAELAAQLDAFEDAWGAAPDYVDGHQHVHILPGVRELLVEEVVRRYPRGRVYLRDCSEAPARVLRRGTAWPKALLLNLLGAGFGARARAAGLATNAGFSGLHDFSGRIPYRRLMHRFITALGPRPLLHCHPGRVDAALRACDRLTDAREAELAYLSSDDFPADLAAAGVVVGRFQQSVTRDGG